MMNRRSAAVVFGAMASAFSMPARADDRKVVEAFYTEFLNASGPKDKAAIVARILSPEWRSIGDYSGKDKSGAELAVQIAAFHQLMPDLTWKIEDMIVSGDRYVVRGRATGTPTGPLFGVDGKGRAFTIMSIDIHEVKGGRIVRSHHVEDWAGALRQLSGR